MAANTAKQLDKTLEDFFKSLPALPPNVVDTIFKITPILALIFGILGLLGALSAFGVLTALSSYAMMAGVHNWGIGILAALGWLASSLLMLAAYPKLKAAKLSGWNLLFWSEIINVVASVIAISIGSILGAAIAFYVIYQIKPKYK